MRINLVTNSITINDNGVSTNIGDQAIRQGATFNIIYRCSGDLSLWTPRGQIRTDFAENDGELLASFSFLQLVYDVETNLTAIPAILKADITATIPGTRYQGEPNVTLSNRNCYVYDIELVDPNDETNVLKIVDTSFVEVKPEATV